MTALMKPPMSTMGILQPRTIQELDTFSQRAASSGMVPPQYDKKPGAIFVAVQFGSELGLSPMQSLINIAVVNGRPAVFADAMVALVRQSPVCEDIKEWFEGEGENLTAWCEARRKGASPVRQSFSVTDAKRANLWGKAGPWTQYPRRMLTWRARSWALRDQFADVLRGLIAYEEAIDIPKGETWSGPTIDGNTAHDVATAPDQPAPDLRDAINKAVPMPPPKRTARAWLDDLRLRVAQCQSTEELDQVAGADDVRKAQQHLKNGALDELNAIFADAMARLHAFDDPGQPVAGEPDDPAFPGDADG